jgi:hypothetical protein
VPERLNEILLRGRPYTPLLLVALVAVTAVTRGLGVALLVLAAGLLLFSIANLWSSVQSLSDEGALSLDEALALAAPSAEEEKKRAVLRALKDLEYERGVGKVSEEDYAVLSARYRDEARRLLQELDKAETPARAKVEALLQKRLEREKLEVAKAAVEKAKAEAAEAEAAEEDDEDDDEEDEASSQRPAPAEAADDEEEEASEPDPATCVDCGTHNDADARFCKQCGKTMT